MTALRTAPPVTRRTGAVYRGRELVVRVGPCRARAERVPRLTGGRSDARF
jgi:hypothetical protein